METPQETALPVYWQQSGLTTVRTDKSQVSFIGTRPDSLKLQLKEIQARIAREQRTAKTLVHLIATLDGTALKPMDCNPSALVF
jgi:hypothetical protein